MFISQIFGAAAPLHEASAFSAFYEQTHRNVFRYVMALCGEQGEAEDITAEAFLRAWRTRDTFCGDSDAATGWIITIARRIAIDRQRIDTRYPIDQLEELVADDSPAIDEIVIANEQIAAVWHAIRQLPLTQRNILILRYVLGWRVNRIAAHLDMAENTVSVNIRRALNRVQQLLPQDKEVHYVENTSNETFPTPASR